MVELIALAALSADGGFFKSDGVDFWGDRREAAQKKNNGDLWADSKAPAPVRRLLEAPTPANAAAYLEWQKRRLARLREAMKAVEAARRAEAPSTLLYFARPGCRFCALQEKELEGLSVRRVPQGSPLWRKHDITVTPTLVVGKRTFRGLTPRKAILKEMNRD